MNSTLELSTDLRAELAEYHVLAAYDLNRGVRYGDMAATRRRGELNRLADALIDAGVPVDRTGHFPSSTPAELADAFDRVARPRIRRVERESFRHGTRYTRATVEAWRVTERRIGAAS